MNHETVLQKKQERLAKYTGSKLNRKRRALDRARVQFANLPKAPKPVESVRPVETVIPVSETRPVKDDAPEWRVEFSDGKSLTVRATSEKKARTAAREAEGLPRLPAGTKVERLSA